MACAIASTPGAGGAAEVAGRLRVCSAGDVAEGEMRAFAVEGVTVPVLVARIDGIYYASSGMCPHEDVELADGSLDPESCTVTCHAHGYCFELATGACTPDSSLTLPTFRTTVEGDDVWIEIFVQR